MKSFIINLLLILILQSCSPYTVHSNKDISNYFGINLDKYKGYYKVGKSYKINGKWYHPKVDHNYDKVGVASWYGPGFHGKMTANGVRYDQRSLTAAHPTLPMPSVVKVTNLENNRSVIVMITDRGPYKKERIIDLSERAAEELDMKVKGVAKVRVQLLQDETDELLIALNMHDKVSGKKLTPKPQDILVADVGGRPPPKSIKANLEEKEKAFKAAFANVVKNYKKTHTEKPVYSGGPESYYVKVGEYNNHMGAIKLASKFHDLGQININREKDISGKYIYKVVIGPIINKTQANRIVEAVYASESNFSPIVVAKE